MGTKVHSKSCFLGYYSMRDLNEDASTSSWSSFYEDKMLTNSQYYNGFTPMAINGYSEYEKECLKQTMLQHEAIFRNQVYELHRLYRRQRNLMDELQKKEAYSCSMSMDKSPLHPFSSQMPSCDTQKMWQMPAAPLADSSYSLPSFSVMGDAQSSPHYQKERKMQSEARPAEKGVSCNDCELMDPKVKKVQKRTFDLELPADVYIDSEEGEIIEKGKSCEVSSGSLSFHGKNYGPGSGNHVNQSLGTSSKHNQGSDDEKLDSNLYRMSHTHCLADLNEPIQELCSEEASTLSLANHLVPVACSGKRREGQVAAKQKLGMLDLSKEFSHNNKNCSENRSLSKHTYTDNEEYRQEWHPHNLKNGQSRIIPSSSSFGFCHEKLPMPSGMLQDADIKKTHELPRFFSSGQSKRETWLRGKEFDGGIPKQDPTIAISNHTKRAASPFPSLSPAVHCTDGAKNATLSVSSWKDLTENKSQVPLVAGQLGNFSNGSFEPNGQNKNLNPLSHGPNIVKEKWDLNISCRPNLNSASELPDHDVFNHQSDNNKSHSRFPLIGSEKMNLRSEAGGSSYEHCDVNGPGKRPKIVHCMDIRSPKDMNLNFPLVNGFKDGSNSQVDLLVINGEEKHKDPLGISCLRTKLSPNESVNVRGLIQKDLDFQPGYSRIMCNPAVESPTIQVKREAEKGPCPRFVEDNPTTSHTKNAEPHRTQVATGASSRIFGFSVLHSSPFVKDPCPYDSSSNSCRDQPKVANSESCVTASVSNVDTSSKPEFPKVKKDFYVEAGHSTDKDCDKSNACFREHINLNCMDISSEERPVKSLDVSVESIGVSASTAPEAPEAPGELKFVIDLEAPVTSLHVMDVIPEKVDLETDVKEDLDKAVQPVQGEIDIDGDDALTRMAAESMVEISSCARSPMDGASCHPSSSSLRDSLVWFSEVVSLNAGDLESDVATIKGRGDGSNESSDDSFDLFEVMTLKLTEIKEECNWKPWEQENQKEEAGPSTLLTRLRKNPRRRGRQKRDFQKDILPGLVSLSRHEVTEDIQTFGELMKASGCSWQTGVARRNAGRNGWHCRGRRRPRGSAAVTAASVGNWASLLPRQLSNGEVEAEGGISLQGWGKNRRCRRQRLATSNPSARLT